MTLGSDRPVIQWRECSPETEEEEAHRGSGHVKMGTDHREAAASPGHRADRRQGAGRLLSDPRGHGALPTP